MNPKDEVGLIEAARLQRGGPLRRLIAMYRRALNIPYPQWKPSPTWPTYRSYVRGNLPITVLQFYWQGASVEGLTGIMYAYKPYTDALKSVDDPERLERLIPQARILFSEANILYKG